MRRVIHKKLFVALISIFVAMTAITTTADKKENSTLDTFMNLMGGEIPFPPERIVEVLRSKGIFVNATIFPHGRSLERRVTSYAQPRSLISFNLAPQNEFGDNNDPSKQVFIAYTPGNNGLQIIAAKKKRPFDFRFVENYRAGSHAVPQKPPSIGLCVACHQNGGAIFTQFPWNETTQNEANIEKMRAQKNLDPFAKYLLNQARIDYFDLNPYRFDLNVRNVNEGYDLVFRDAREKAKAKTRQNACLGGCGPSHSCRKTLITLALTAALNGITISRSHLNDRFFNRERLRDFVNDIEKNGRPDLFFIRDDLLSDRNPIGNEMAVASGMGNDPLIPRYRVSPLLQSFKKVEPLIPGRSPRPGELPPFLLGEKMVNTLVTFAEECFQFNRNQIAVLEKLSEEQFLAALDSTQMDQLVRAWPVSSQQIVQTFLDSANKVNRAHSSPLNVVKACDTPKDQYKPLSATADANLNAAFMAATMMRTGVTSLTHRKPKDLFLVFCSACHLGRNAPAPPLPLTNMNQLKAYVGIAGRTIEQMLKGPDKLMPPMGTLMPSDKDRAEMIRATQRSSSMRIDNSAGESTRLPLGAASL